MNNVFLLEVETDSNELRGDLTGALDFFMESFPIDEAVYIRLSQDGDTVYEAAAAADFQDFK